MKKIYKYGSFLSGAVLIATTALTQTAFAEIKFKRDDYGVARIEATTNNEMFFAFGLVQARDRLLQMELLRQNSWGELPTKGVRIGNKFLGDKEIANRHVRNAKTAHRYPNMRENLKNRLAKLEQTAKDSKVNTVEALRCFAEGVNAFRSIVSGKNLQPNSDCGVFEFPNSLTIDVSIKNDEKKFIIDTFISQQIILDKNANWSDIDVLAIFQNRVMDEFSYRNTDLDNMRLLLNLIKPHGAENAGKMFNSIKWSLMPAAKTTIPLPPKNEKKAKKLKGAAQSIARDYHQKLIASMGENEVNGCRYSSVKSFNEKSGTAQFFAENSSSDDQFARNASHWWAISKRGSNFNTEDFPGVAEGVKSILYNGPQTGANDPSNTYQIALKSDENFQFAGNTYTGTINFWQGHNGTMAFGLTAGNIDVADSFCVPVTFAKGVWTYKIKGNKNAVELEENALATKEYNGAAKANNMTEGTLYNVAGKDWPVIFIDDLGDDEGTAYIQRSNWEGLEATTLHSMLQATQSTNFKEWNTHLNTVAANFNLSAAHKDGAIGYRLTGKIPIKHGMSKSKDTEYGELIPPSMEKSARKWNYFPDFDTRLPVPYAPEDGWDNKNDIYHSLKFESKMGFLANWNQKPWTLMPDGELYYDGYYPYDRVQFIINELRRGKKPWTLIDTIKMSSDLARLDVNYFSYKFFLRELLISQQLDPNNKPALKTLLDWRGYREAKPSSDKNSEQGVHYGHVLFYEILEALNKELIKIVMSKKDIVMSKKDKDFYKQLTTKLFKLKQPKLNGKKKVDKPITTFDTSQNMQMSSRVMLNALHYHLNLENSDAQKYTYDDSQYIIFKNKETALETLNAALTTALEEIQNYEGYKQIDLKNKAVWFPIENRTFMGHPTTLGARDLKVSFRPEALYFNDYRNRGALNLAVAFKDGGTLEAKNLTPPGIREYRGVQGALDGGPTDNADPKDKTSNQSKAESEDKFREMHDIKENRLKSK